MLDFTKLVGKTFSRIYVDHIDEFTFLGNSTEKNEAETRFMIAPMKGDETPFSVDKQNFIQCIKEKKIVFSKK